MCATPKFVMAYKWNPKMIGWRMVIHVSIDGCSRLVIYLHCANDNLAETGRRAISMISSNLSLHVHSDHGLDNAGVV